MKKLKTDSGCLSSPNCAQETKQQNNQTDLICVNNNNSSVVPRHHECGEKRKGCVFPAHRCHKKVLCSKVTGKQMDAQRQNYSLFRHSSFVIGILLGLMCCGSLHAKGRTEIIYSQRKKMVFLI
jgi:hypothetical protein